MMSKRSSFCSLLIFSNETSEQGLRVRQSRPENLIITGIHSLQSIQCLSFLSLESSKVLSHHQVEFVAKQHHS